MKIRKAVLPGTPPKKICLALVADLHSKVPNDLMDVLEAQRPTAVLFTGDTVHGKGKYKEGLAFVHECALRFPTVCSLGNHEFKYGADFREKLGQTGAMVVDDSYIRMGDLVIGGLTSGFAGKGQGTFHKTPAPNLNWLDGFCQEKGYRILLSHHPEYFDLLKPYQIDLILSGHAHGGQFRIFGIPFFAPGQGFCPRYTSGFYQNKMFVSRGISNTAPIPRIGNPTELVFFTSEG
ncbi:MAG: metallophosphoesterase [Clostridia bacterium]|nr:metallophosphoesterase [Clostridia bacterium]